MSRFFIMSLFSLLLSLHALMPGLAWASPEDESSLPTRDLSNTHSPKENTEISISTKDKRHKCTFTGCERAFSQSSDLTKHIRTHTGEKPFKCTNPGCGKEFIDASHLVRHTRTHTGEKPFKCTNPGCRKEFRNSSNLIRHTRTHIPKRELDLSCSVASPLLTQLDRDLKRLRDAAIKLEEMSDTITVSKNEDPLPRKRKKFMRKFSFTEEELKEGLSIIYPDPLRARNDSNCLSIAKEVCLWLGEGREMPSRALDENSVDTTLYENHQDDGQPKLAYAKIGSSSLNDSLNSPEAVYYLEEEKSLFEEKPDLLLHPGKLSKLESALSNLNSGDTLIKSQIALIYLQLRHPITNSRGVQIEGHYLNLYISGSKENRKYEILDASQETKDQKVALGTFLKYQRTLYQDDFLYRFHNQNDIHLELRPIALKQELFEK